MSEMLSYSPTTAALMLYGVVLHGSRPILHIRGDRVVVGRVSSGYGGENLVRSTVNAMAQEQRYHEEER